MFDLDKLKKTSFTIWREYTRIKQRQITTQYMLQFQIEQKS